MLLDISIMELVIEDEVELENSPEGPVGFKFSSSSEVRIVAVISATLGIEAVIRDFG